MSNKLAVITGATSGIGLVGAKAIAKAGYDLVLPCRNMEKGESVKKEIAAGAPDAKIDLIHCDMASLADVQACGKEIAAQHANIDLLINNAGLAALSLQFTQDGIEKGFAVNHLSHFVLTQHLIAPLKAGEGARIVHTSSEASQQGNAAFMDDINYKHHKFKFFKAYGNSKLANILFSNKLAADWPKDNVVSNAFHPGRVATNIWPDSTWYQKLIIVPLKKLYLISPEQGAKPMIKLALDDDMAGVSGRFLFEMNEKDPGEQARDKAWQDKLWDLSLELSDGFLPN